VDEVFDYLDTKNSKIKAAGIDLLDLMKEDIDSPKRLVNVKNIDDLKFIKIDTKRGLILGPNITLTELAEEEQLKNSFLALAQAAGGAAIPQVRNSATLAGNICQRPRCWYFRSNNFDCLRKGGDTCFALDGENRYHAILGNDEGCVIVHPSATAVALMALNAKIKIKKAKEEKEISIDDFFITPEENITRENILQDNELITEIIIPGEMEEYTSYYIKQKEKQTFDWPIADVAVAIKIRGDICEDSRIVLGAAAPVPWRVKSAELILNGNPITKKSARLAAEKAVEKAEPLSDNGYKIQVFRAIIYRTICKASGIDPFE
jgi:xanthine dehydrogenase YagS FAD-binding subunit